jgi:SAM-dependent methyltransferase
LNDIDAAFARVLAASYFHLNAAAPDASPIRIRMISAILTMRAMRKRLRAVNAAAEQWTVALRQVDAEALPFADQSFDVVLSTFGMMFTPNQEQTAGERARVVRKVGRIGLANWTPDGFIGHLFKTIGKYVLPPAGIKSPAL